MEAVRRKKKQGRECGQRDFFASSLVLGSAESMLLLFYLAPCRPFANIYTQTIATNIKRDQMNLKGIDVRRYLRSNSPP